MCKKTGDLANQDMEKPKYLITFFCSGLFRQDFQPYELQKVEAGAGK